MLVAHAAVRERRLEAARTVLRELENARIVGIAVQIELSRPVVVRRAKVSLTGADLVAFGQTRVCRGFDAPCRAAPLALPTVEVAGGDAVGHREALADVGLP